MKSKQKNVVKESELGLTVKKESDFSEWYTQVVQKAELVDVRFGIQGFVVHRPWGFAIIKKIYEYFEKEVEEQGHQQFLFPTVVKEKALNQEKEHAGFTPEVFWVSEAGDQKIEERFALRPTGEAQIYPIYALWLRSYRDLPFRGYQDRISVFRNEMTTRPFLRGREFLFFETHDVFNKHEESLKQIQNDLETCWKVIYEKLKIPFFYFKRPFWDKFNGADATFTPDTLMPDGKRNQLASTHDLGQNFSKAFEIKVAGEDEKEHYVWQTCFGPGIWRIMAALIGIHGDDKGLVLPFEVAPVQVVIIPIFLKKTKMEETRVSKLANLVKEKLQKEGYRVKLDEGEETPGYKYHHWELLGVPIRIEIGPKEVQEMKLTLVKRTDTRKLGIKLESLQKEIKKNANSVDVNIKERANTYFKGSVKNADTLEQLKRIIKVHLGFTKVPFCSVEKQGEKCAEKLQKETDGVKVCGTFYPKPEKPKQGQKCLVCNRKAFCIVYVAKSY